MGRGSAARGRRSSHRRSCDAALTAAAFLSAAALLTVVQGASEEENKGWVLRGHSFERTLTYDDRLGDWLASAGTMALRDRLQLLPPVPDRFGVFWSKKAATTKNFEVSFSIRVFPSKQKGPEDGVFAFWISPDNFTATYDEQAIVSTRNWTQGLQDAGLTFISNRPAFRGIGLLFQGLDQKGALRPSVTAMMCDEGKVLSMSDYPAPQDGQVGRHQTKYVDWREKEVDVKIRAQLGGVITGTLQVKGQPAVEIFRLPAEGASDWSSNYIGFSGWSGSESYLEVDMNRLEMRNFDMKLVGEDQQEAEDILDGDTENWKAVLENEKRFIDQKSQKEAVERLTKLLSDYVEKHNQMGDKVKSELVWLEKRVAALDSEVSLLTGTSKSLNPETGEIDPAVLKDHITGIKTILTRDKEVHDEKFSHVRDVARTLKEKGGGVLGPDGRAKVESVADQAKALENHVAEGTTKTGGLFILLVLAVCVLGLLFLNRMRYYEKKHYI